MCGIDARCPYLDFRIVNLKLGLSDEAKVPGRQMKIALREVAAPLLPSRIATRRKHTFRVPVGDWLRGPLRHLLLTLKTSAVLRSLTSLRLDVIRRLVDDHSDGHADYSKALWIIVTLHVWLEEASRRVSLEAQP